MDKNINLITQLFNTRIDNLETIVKPMNLQKAYYGIYGTLYSFDGKTFERVLKLTTDDVEYPDTLSGMLTMCTINGLSYFNINGKIYSFDGAKFTYVETLRLPEELTPNMVNKNTYISVI
jgi:hypothetical protein